MIWKIFLIIDLCFHLVAIFEGKLLISSHENWIQIDVNSQTYLVVCHIRISHIMLWLRLQITLYFKIYTKSKTISIIQTNHQRTFFIGRMCIENVFWCQICILDNYLSCEGEFLFSIIVPLSFLKHWPNNTKTKTMMAMMTLAIEKQWVECRKSQ